MQRSHLSILSSQNPIVDAEFRHQRFVIVRGRTGTIWIILAGLLVVPALLLSILITAVSFINPFYPLLDITTFGNGNALGLVVGMNFILYPVVMLVTFGLSANSIRREKFGHTWDNLRLTDIHPRQIVWGKWWASFRALRGDHLMVLILRFGLVTAFVVGLRSMTPTPFDLPPEVVHLPLFLLITVIFTLLDAGVTAALGISVAVVDRTGPIVAVLAIAFRIVLTLLALIFMFFTLIAQVLGIGFYLAISALGIAFFGLVIWGILRGAQDLVG